MTLSTILALLVANRDTIIAIGTAVAALWHAIPQAKRDAFEQSFPRLVGFVRMAVAFLPTVRDIGLALYYQVILGVPKADVLAERGKLPPPPAVPTGLLALLAFALLLAGCPTYPRPACPQVGSYSCINDQPAYCDVGGWTVAGDTTCARVGGVCTLRGRQAVCATRAESTTPTP